MMTMGGGVMEGYWGGGKKDEAGGSGDGVKEGYWLEPSAKTEKRQW